MQTDQILLNDLSLLAELGAFEIYGPDSQGICRIPYMMNDAVEIYYEFMDCACNGLLEENFSENTKITIIQGDNRRGLRMCDGTNHASWLWFRSYKKSSHFYQYHRIGHFWIEGQEQWRQLVYMIGTIYDKFTFLGEEGCNVNELEILGLVTFAPFRYWSPVEENLESRYPDAEVGVKQMLSLAREAGDDDFVKLLKRYQKMAAWPVIGKRVVRETIQAMIEPKRRKLYHLLYDKICRASEQWEVRRYDTDTERKMLQLRNQTDSSLKSRGYEGEYPFYKRGSKIVFAAEEHPFTVMDDDFCFKIHLMVSETRKPASYNDGFFDEEGACGKIIKNLYGALRENE